VKVTIRSLAMASALAFVLSIIGTRICQVALAAQNNGCLNQRHPYGMCPGAAGTMLCPNYGSAAACTGSDNIVIQIDYFQDLAPVSEAGRTWDPDGQDDCVIAWICQWQGSCVKTNKWDPAETYDKGVVSNSPCNKNGG